MSTLNTTIFVDIASKLKLADPAFIEKDYFGVKLLKIIADLHCDDWELCFAGGTCLAKAHLANLARMSEDGCHCISGCD